MITYFVLSSIVLFISYMLVIAIKLCGGIKLFLTFCIFSFMPLAIIKLSPQTYRGNIKDISEDVGIGDNVTVSVNSDYAKIPREAISESIKRDAQVELERLVEEFITVNSKREEISLNIYGGSIFGHVGALMGPSISDMADLDNANRDLYEIRNSIEGLNRKLSLMEHFDPESNVKNFFSRGAEIAHSAPKEMLYNKSTDIEFVLVPESAGVSAKSLMTNNNDEEYFSRSDIEYSTRMQVTLEGKSFDIAPAGPQIRRMIGDMPMEWHWNIIPIEYGSDKQISFRLDAIHYSGENYEIVATETYKAIVFVDVGWFDWVDKKIEKIGNLGSAIGGLIMILVGTLGFYFEYVRKKPSEFT